ncbi:synaptosomal-associated protein 29-like [Diadema antillarum]|uniref:synaptosomal-associated protein 29-like n=1 Tax=Diadema antillarum TaxID=105358 RepID=UPI003A8B8B1D
MSSSNPFFDDESAGGGGAGNTWNDWDDLGKDTTDYDPNKDYGFGVQSKQMELERRKQNMLDSTHRSMGLMYEAEQVGNETAAELLHQGEQLRRVDNKLDKIDSDLDTSKKHITSMKSIFGGIANYFSKSKPAQPDAPKAQGPSKLAQHMERVDAEEEMRRENTDHPALQIRGVGASRSTNAGSWGTSSSRGGGGGGGFGTSGFGEESSGQTADVWQSSSHMRDFDNQLNSNLDDIGSGLSRLKGLALGLNDELERQNDDIDRITGKVERVDDKLVKTDKDVKKILRR